QTQRSARRTRIEQVWVERGKGSTRCVDRSRVGPKTSQHLSIGGNAVLALGGFQDLDYVIEPGVRHDSAKWTGAERSFRNQLVSIATGCKRCLRIVEMQAAEEIQTERRVPLSPDSLIVQHQIVTRRVEVAGIGAVRYSVTDIRPNHLPECPQLLEITAQSGAAAGGGLQQ